MLPFMTTLLERSIPYFVTLIDCVGTRFEVAARWKGGLLHFCEGWSRLGSHYKLRFGGWVIMTYSDDFVFKIVVRDRSLYTVPCPKPSLYYAIGNADKPIVIDADDFALEKFKCHDLTCTPTAYCTTLTLLDLISLVRFLFLFCWLLNILLRSLFMFVPFVLYACSEYLSPFVSLLSLNPSPKSLLLMSGTVLGLALLSGILHLLLHVILLKFPRLAMFVGSGITYARLGG